MAVAIRGTTPQSTTVTTASISTTLTGSRQPNTFFFFIIMEANDFYTTSTMPTPTVGGSSTGVTAVTNGTADGGSNNGHAKAYTFVCTSTADRTVAVTETGSADEEKALVVYVLSGVDTTTPVDVAGNGVNTGTTTHICPSISPSSSDAFLICHTNTGGGAAAASYTQPSGMTESLDTVTGGMSMGGATLQLSASGATGTKTFTPNTSITASANLSIAMKTAGAAAAGQRTPTLVETDPAVRESVRRHHIPATTLATCTPVQGPVAGTMVVTQADQTMVASGTVVNPPVVTGAVVSGVAAATALRRRRQPSSIFVDLGVSATVPDITGSLAETQDDQTMAASGTVTISGNAGSLAETQDNQTMAASGQLGYSGSLARTQADQTMAAAGTVTGPVTGTFARIQADQTMTASGAITVNTTGTAAMAQANQTMAATGVASSPPTGLEPVAMFTPPLIEGNPPTVSYGHPGNRLMRNYGNWAQGATVWKDSQGIWHESVNPYEGGATHIVHNLWRNGVGPTSTYSTPDEGLATAQRVYLGGHVYPITAEEEADLIAAGYAANITPLP